MGNSIQLVGQQDNMGNQRQSQIRPGAQRLGLNSHQQDCSPCRVQLQPSLPSLKNDVQLVSVCLHL